MCKKDLRGRIMQYDNAKAHVSPKTQEWLRKNGIETLEQWLGLRWPARSPDLSPIETLWAIVKRNVERKHHPLTQSELVRAWTVEWAAVPQTTIDSLVRSFSDRLQRCKDAGGRTITP